MLPKCEYFIGGKGVCLKTIYFPVRYVQFLWEVLIGHPILSTVGEWDLLHSKWCQLISSWFLRYGHWLGCFLDKDLKWVEKFIHIWFVYLLAFSYSLHHRYIIFSHYKENGQDMASTEYFTLPQRRTILLVIWRYHTTIWICQRSFPSASINK